MLEVPGALALIVALASVVVLLLLRLREQGPAAVERAAGESARLRDERDALAAELEALTGRTGEARAALRSALDEAAPEVARLEQLRASTTAARDALDAQRAELEAELARLRAQRAELEAAVTTAPAAPERVPAPQSTPAAPSPQAIPTAPARTPSIDLAAVAAAIGTGSAEPALGGRVGATRATEALPADEGEHR